MSSVNLAAGLQKKKKKKKKNRLLILFKDRWKCFVLFTSIELTKLDSIHFFFLIIFRRQSALSLDYFSLK